MPRSPINLGLGFNGDGNIPNPAPPLRSRVGAGFAGVTRDESSGVPHKIRLAWAPLRSGTRAIIGE